MCSDWSSDYEVIRAGIKSFDWSHYTFLIASDCPTWTDPRHNHLDFLPQLAANHFDFVRAGHNAIDSLFDTQPGEAQNLIVHCPGNADFAQRLFGRAR